MIGHEDFKTNGVQRAIWGHTSPKNEAAEDGNGHGTHVASTIVGTDRGVAKSAKVYAVKVLRSSGYGSNADVIDVNYICISIWPIIIDDRALLGLLKHILLPKPRTRMQNRSQTCHSEVDILMPLIMRSKR